MSRIMRENGLSIVLFALFFLTFAGGQSLTGYREYNHEQENHNQPTIGYFEYLRTPHFLEATAENWESEFLQANFSPSAVWLSSRSFCASAVRRNQNRLTARIARQATADESKGAELHRCGKLQDLSAGKVRIVGYTTSSCVPAL
ncbi:MAG TPA: hypothetical protein PKE45_15025 [Caldilineaceae bacterium]|nr:hypothetical protein [Caldilineaceae bacterium]